MIKIKLLNKEIPVCNGISLYSCTGSNHKGVHFKLEQYFAWEALLTMCSSSGLSVNSSTTRSV